MLRRIILVLLIALLPQFAFAAGGGKSLNPEEMLADIFMQKDYEFDRVASLNPCGPNGSNVMQPGELREIANIEGPGIMTHIWFTLSRRDDYVLKDCVLRI